MFTVQGVPKEEQRGIAGTGPASFGLVNKSGNLLAVKAAVRNAIRPDKTAFSPQFRWHGIRQLDGWATLGGADPDVGGTRGVGMGKGDPLSVGGPLEHPWGPCIRGCIAGVGAVH